MDILYQAFMKKSIDMSNSILPELDHDKKYNIYNLFYVRNQRIVFWEWRTKIPRRIKKKRRDISETSSPLNTSWHLMND